MYRMGRQLYTASNQSGRASFGGCQSYSLCSVLSHSIFAAFSVLGSMTLLLAIINWVCKADSKVKNRQKC
jgi:hypothetical protein